MEQYIKKSALVAELERRLKVLYKDRDFNYLQIKELEALLSFLDTLEVKEVDLELSWEDIEAIDQIFTDVFKDGFDVITDSYYQEVLKRFKNLRHVK